MVTSTGKIMPSGSFWVLALNCLQKSMMFTPWGPSAVPTGGAGVALPAGNCSLMVVCTFFGGMALFIESFLAQLLNAREIQFHGRGASENRYRNLQAAMVVVDLFDHPVEVRKRPVDDAHLLVALVNHFRFRAIHRSVHAIDNRIHFRFRKRRR